MTLTRTWGGFRVVLLKAVSSIYRRIFHEEMTQDVRAFLRNLLFVSIGTGFSVLLSTLFTVLGGRLLGPEEYGKFVLIQSAATFLYLPMVMGYNNAMVKYASERQDSARQVRIIALSFFLVFVFSAASVILYLLFSFRLSLILSIPTGLFSLAIIFALLLVFFNLATSILRSLNRMQALAIFQSLTSGILLLFFLFFILFRTRTFEALVYPSYLAYGISSLIIVLPFIIRRPKFEFDRGLIKLLSKYSVFSAIGGLSYILYNNADKILINRYMGVADTGIYSAYYTSSITVAALLLGIFITVFFPAVSKYKNKETIYRRINKLVPYLVLGGIPLLLVSEFIVLKLYGEGYPLVLPLMILFAGAAVTMVLQGIYTWLLSSAGTRGVRISSLVAIIAATVNFGLNVILIPEFGIPGAISCLIITYVVSTLVAVRLGKNCLIKDVDETS